MTNGFTHRPARRDLRKGVMVSPHNKVLWDRMWAEARKQDWFHDRVGYVANDGVHFYFQSPGVVSGLAMVTLS